VFRLMFDDEDTGRYMATVAHESRRSHVGVYYIRNGYGRALANAFEEHAAALGMQVVDRRSYDPSGPQEDLSGIVREWKQRDVDGVFIAGEAREAAEFARALRAGGLVVPLFGGDALGVPELLRDGGHDVDGMLIPAPFHVDDDRAEVRAFVAAFRARYGAAPDALAALGYDAVRAVAGALRRRADGTPAALAAALRDSAGGAGVTGTLSFDDAGDRRQVHMVTLGVQGGAFELVVPSARVVARR
jgi:branched-chain amino acid transport system substrate-binding protein